MNSNKTGTLGQIIFELTGFNVIPVKDSKLGIDDFRAIFSEIQEKVTDKLQTNPIISQRVNESGNEYLPKNCSIGDLADLPVTLKQELNSNNVELYKQERKILDHQT